MVWRSGVWSLAARARRSSPERSGIPSTAVLVEDRSHHDVIAERVAGVLSAVPHGAGSLPFQDRMASNTVQPSADACDCEGPHLSDTSRLAAAQRAGQTEGCEPVPEDVSPQLAAARTKDGQVRAAPRNPSHARAGPSSTKGGCGSGEGVLWFWTARQRREPRQRGPTTEGGESRRCCRFLKSSRDDEPAKGPESDRKREHLDK